MCEQKSKGDKHGFLLKRKHFDGEKKNLTSQTVRMLELQDYIEQLSTKSVSNKCMTTKEI